MSWSLGKYTRENLREATTKLDQEVERTSFATHEGLKDCSIASNHQTYTSFHNFKLKAVLNFERNMLAVFYSPIHLYNFTILEMVKSTV